MPCENCKRMFVETTLLRHIGKAEACKSFYGQKFEEMKKEKGRKKVQRHRFKTQMTSNQLKKQRESYAKNLKMKEKKDVCIKKTRKR